MADLILPLDLRDVQLDVDEVCRELSRDYDEIHPPLPEGWEVVEVRDRNRWLYLTLRRPLEEGEKV